MYWKYFRKSLNFAKRVKRNNFTKIFGGINARRTMASYERSKPFRLISTTKFERLRRSRMGAKNTIYSRLTALKIHIKYERRIGRRWWQK